MNKFNLNKLSYFFSFSQFSLEHILPMFFVSIILMLLIGNTAFGQIVYVDTNATGANNGTSWTDAYTNLYTPLDNASAGEQIWVAKGTYTPYDTGRGARFNIPNGVSLYGGFVSGQQSINDRSDYGPGGNNETILSGDIGTQGADSDNVYRVVNFYNVDGSTILDGFTITGGNADSSALSNNGSAISVAESSPTIENCAIIGNSAQGASIIILAFNNVSTPRFINCIISGNTSTYNAGAVSNVAFYASLYTTITNCLITGNKGGGVTSQATSTGDCVAKFINCTISGNSIPQIEGNGSLDTTIFKNSIIWNSGDHVQNYESTSIFYYSLVAGSGGSSSWKTSYGTDGGNNIDQDPLFNTILNPSSAPSTGGDFHLKKGSPALDSGTPADDVGVDGIPLTDINGNPRPLPSGATNVDMGVYEEDETSPLPVELTSFSAIVNDNKVELKWKTATEVNCYGFELERQTTNDLTTNNNGSHSSLVDGHWTSIGFVKGAGNSNSTKQYSFLDSDPGNSKVEYRLKQIDNDGTIKYSKTIEVNLAAPAKFALMQNYPNPFNPSTTINYDIPKAEHVTLKVYNILGNVIETLVDKEQAAGSYQVQFAIGSKQLAYRTGRLASGMYLYRLQAGSFVQTKKMILLK